MTDGSAEDVNSALRGLASLRVAHAGLVVRDIETRAQSWAEVLGIPLPEVSMTPDQHTSNMAFEGIASPARARQCMLRFPGFAIELLEPVDDQPSTWATHLREHGEGIHHLAFVTDGELERHLREVTTAGCPVVQTGGWPAGPTNSSGTYSYLGGTRPLGAIVELLDLHPKA